MVVNKTNILNFTELIKLKGEVESVETLLTITPSSITTLGKSSNNTLAFRGELKGEFEEMGEIGIDNLQFLRNAINSFSSANINVAKKENKLNITSDDVKLKVAMILRSPQYITTKLELKEYEKVYNQAKGNDFTLTKEQIKKISGYVSSLNPTEIIFEGKDNQLTFKLINNENKISDTFELDNNIKEFKVTLRRASIDILNFLGSDVKMSISQDCPILFRVEEESFWFEYIMAPLK